ncbi:hypothetical protein H3C61_00690 [Candidatus Gracilibacteria bacterium]|nr:hypothetical protein [Candidatus Gracilibacteria bacterium]
MTTIILKEDLKLTNNVFKTKVELIDFLLNDYQDLVLSDEMQKILDNSTKNDFVSYDDFVSKYKK